MFLRKIFSVAILLALVLPSSFAQADAAAGKALFKANCQSCHAGNMKTKLTGPALAGLEERWADYPREDLYSWIRNSQAMISAGHPRALELWNEYKPVVMNNFTNLTDDQIESLIAYINETANAVPAAASGDGVVQAKKEEGFPYLYVGLAVGLALLALALMRIANNLSNVERATRGLAPVERTLNQRLTSQGTIAFIIFAMTLVFGYRTVDNATKMGRQQEYKPEQPINFSHKIHAGINKIDCQYCHDGARRSKHSVIPAANTCMNCHSAIKKGTITGTSEITKIFASIGYDPDKGAYIDGYEDWSEDQIAALYKKWIGANYMEAKGTTSLDGVGKTMVDKEWNAIAEALKNDSNGKIQGPIEWVKIHNLADHVYFSHQQHVSVGKIECQQCHGKVEEMDVVEQYSTLGMGWCINCHRETDVQFNDNAFYDQYERYHKELANGERESVKVEDIGGLECQKCHY